MQAMPELPKGVTWDDVELVPDPDRKDDRDMETTFVARNRKTGDIYR